MALPVNIKDLLHDRDHRNRRIGDFLKELELTEGRGTGFPTIYRVMERNGSAEPVFETDDQSTHFLTILPARVEKSNPAGNQASVGVNDLQFNKLEDIVAFFNQVSVGAGVGVQALVHANIHDKVEDILIATKNWIKRADLFAAMGLSNHSKNRQSYLDPLLHVGWIQLEHPNNMTHPNQRYKITDAGRRYLDFVQPHS